VGTSTVMLSVFTRQSPLCVYASVRRAFALAGRTCDVVVGGRRRANALRMDESQVKKSALSIIQKQLGEAHPDVAKANNNIGLVLQTMGRMDEAKPYFIKAVESYEASLGASHPNLATSLNNLAGCVPRRRIFALTPTRWPEP
jgi:tetratricopeptide (TPR) repeat protein